MFDLKHALENSMLVRVLGPMAVAAVLMTPMSCRDDLKDEEIISVQTTDDFSRLKLLVEECETAHTDASSYTAESYATFAEALNKANSAISAGISPKGDYAGLFEGLMAARKGLTLIEWVPITDYLPQCSMLVVICESDLPQKADAGDRLGAFAGDKCLGVASPEKQPDGRHYFFLQILQDCADEYNTDIRITLKYHSVTTNLVYQTDEMKYEDQCILGSYAEPYRPQWQ